MTDVGGFEKLVMDADDRGRVSAAVIADLSHVYEM
jgi:hypothetical protein